MPKLTVRSLDTLRKQSAGATASDGSIKGEGALVAVRTTGGIVWYYRYVKTDGKQDRLGIGPYDPDNRNGGLGLVAARAKCAELTARYRIDKDLRAALQRDEAAKVEEEKRLRLAATAEAKADEATLEALLKAYVEHLTRAGKPSARAVEKSLRKHVMLAHPEIAARRAVEITTDDLLDILAKLTDPEPTADNQTPRPILREAAKLRSYIRAAYAAAIAARTKTGALPALRKLEIRANPARELEPVEGNSKPRDRALSVVELRHYWRRINKIPAPWGPMLQFHLLTGGQRVEQLCRATLEHLDSHEHYLVLWDGKGRRKVARRHVVPLIAAAEAALESTLVPCPDENGELVRLRLGPHLLTSSNGEKPTSPSSLGRVVKAVARAMWKANEIDAGKGTFTIGDLRRSVETRLAGWKVSSDVRAQLQSHGLGGVQARHYDRYEYQIEMRAALEKLLAEVSKEPPKLGLVVPFAQAVAS